MSATAPATRGPASLEAMREQFPIICPIKVQWGDMDALGHVNNVVYFQYLENARIALQEELNIFPRLFDEGYGLVIADARCKYKAPVVYPDQLHIGMRVEMQSPERLVIHYAAFSESLQRVAIEAETVQVGIDPKTGRKTALPAWYLSAMATLS